MNLVLRVLLATGLLLLGAVSARAQVAENIGRADRVKNTVTGHLKGKRTKLKVGSSVFQNQRIRAGRNSTAQIRFKDNTRLAIHANGSVVLDEAVFSGRKKNKLFLKAARGAFRFASGSLRKDAYKIVTPSSTVGIRGTMFDMFIGGRGETIVMLLHGRLRACSRSGTCRTLTNPCDAIRITRGGRISTGRGLTRTVLGGNRASRVAPFMYFQGQLLNSMRVGRGTVRQCVDVDDTDAADPGGSGVGGSEPPGRNGGGNNNHDGDDGYIG